MTPKTGTLYGVGVGPGDPELMTLRAHRVLSSVSAVFVPRKDEDSDSIALSIIGNCIDNARQEVISLIMPMVEDGVKLTPYWETAAERIWERLSLGQDCAFVNVGDPLLYGSFIHVMRTVMRCHPEAKVQVIPGISSVSASAAVTLSPLATGNERLAIIGPDNDANFVKSALRDFDTIVFLKVNRRFTRILPLLEEMNLVGKSVVVQRCAMKGELVERDIRKLNEDALDYFSLLLVRK